MFTRGYPKKITILGEIHIDLGFFPRARQKLSRNRLGRPDPRRSSVGRRCPIQCHCMGRSAKRQCCTLGGWWHDKKDIFYGAWYNLLEFPWISRFFEENQALLSLWSLDFRWIEDNSRIMPLGSVLRNPMPYASMQSNMRNHSWRIFFCHSSW